MADVAYIAGVAGVGTTGTISITHGLTIQAGDVIVVTITANGDAGTLVDNNGATPFTKEFGEQQPGSGASAYYSIFSRVCGSSEPSAFAFTLGGTFDGPSEITVPQFRNVDPQQRWEVAPS